MQNAPILLTCIKRESALIPIFDLLFEWPLKTGFTVQSNLVNSMFLGLVVLFQIINSSNYREVDIKIYNPPKGLLSVFSSIEQVLGM